MQAAFNAAAAIQAGHLDVVVASGVESMSRVPMGSNLAAGGFEGFSTKMYERWQIVPQGISAEVDCRRSGTSARGPRRVLATSRTGARSAAIDDGRFEREIVPIEVGAGGAAVLFGVDETPRRDTSTEKLASLQPAFMPDGVVTAGSSSRSCDGAAAMLVASERAGQRLGLEPRGASSRSGSRVSTRIGCCTATRRRASEALAKAGLGWDDIAVIEINEAFASVVLQIAEGHGPRRALGGRRREPERGRHLAGSSPRRDRSADHGDAC